MIQILNKAYKEHQLMTTKQVPKEPPIPKGCDRYYFADFSCIAISKKRALEKYNKYLIT